MKPGGLNLYRSIKMSNLASETKGKKRWQEVEIRKTHPTENPVFGGFSMFFRHVADHGGHI